jgi:exodeoxyribonuclease VII large subunit
MIEVETLTQRRVYSVSEITREIRHLLEENFTGVWIEGEICNFKFHTSGHMYFSLKDESAQIQCVMFRSDNQRLGFELKEGMSILCFGRVSVYPVRGQYQVYAERIEPKGVGALQLQFLQLKEKLMKEGLFDEERKKPIPYLPSRIGVITSVDGAALRDILQVLSRRFSNSQILIGPAAVQGEGAGRSIAQAIEDFNRFGGVDVLIVTRGGGSLEDLWAFNEEVVARAIFLSEIPVISAVGHEVDFTIADFVADLRAPTPSAAAEIVMPLREELVARVLDLEGRLLQDFTDFLKSLRQELKRLTQAQVFRDPLGLFDVQSQRLDELKKRLSLCLTVYLRLKREGFLSLVGKLDVLGPLSALKRGFSVSLKLPERKPVTSFETLKPGDWVETKLLRGFFVSEVKEARA